MKKESIVKGYTYFFNKIINSHYSNLDLKRPREDKLIENFLKRANQRYRYSIGVNWLFDYLSFQFEYWQGLETHRNVSPTWIFGKKAFERFENRKDSYQYFYEKNILEPYFISKIDFVNLFSEDEEPNAKTNKVEEIEKERFLNTQRGFIHCIQNTTMYNHYSSNCIKCVFKSDCKSILRQKMPEIANVRGYGEYN